MYGDITIRCKKEFHAERASIIDPPECSSLTRSFDPRVNFANEKLLLSFDFLQRETLRGSKQIYNISSVEKEIKLNFVEPKSSSLRTVK